MISTQLAHLLAFPEEVKKPELSKKVSRCFKCGSTKKPVDFLKLLPSNEVRCIECQLRNTDPTNPVMRRLGDIVEMKVYK